MSNPYSAPNAVLSERDDEEFYEPKVFSVHGRIGRVRYLAYSFGLMLLFMAIIGVLSAALIPTLGAGAMIVLGLLYIPMIVSMFVMMKRRLNDLDHSGWLSLLGFIPLVNLFFSIYLTFWAGSAGTNSYGAKPVKNSGLAVAGACILPAVFIIGILAAVAIPAYQGYVNRAKSARIAPVAVPATPSVAQ